jgi:hypothetical protein
MVPPSTSLLPQTGAPPLRSEGMLGESLIFVISQPRAGSTLLQRILGGHALVETSAEPWLMLHPIYALKESGHEAEYDRHLAHSALLDFLEHYAEGETTYLHALRALAWTLYGTALSRSGKQLFLDKTPRYYFIIPELYRLFPRARFIFLVRNPLAVLHSVLATWVRGDWPLLADYRHDLLTAPQRLLDGVRLLGRDAILVRYEDLVSNPSSCVSQLCERLGLAFSSELLSYGERPAPRGRMGDALEVGRQRGPVSTSLDTWVKLAASEQTRHFAWSYLQALGADFIEQLGYSFDTLRRVLGPDKPQRGSVLVPWRIALQPAASWTFSDRFIVERALAVQKDGRLIGTYRAARGSAVRAVGALVRTSASQP